MHSDFKELFALFDEHRVRYFVVGGYAVMLYSERRSTKEIDAAAAPTREEIERAAYALEVFGFPMSGRQRTDFHNLNSMIVLGHPPNRIDVLNSLMGVSFDEAFDRRNLVDVERSQIPFISLEDLIAAKVASNRPQDRIDGKKLRRVRRK